MFRQEQYARIAARWGLTSRCGERFGHCSWRLLRGDMGYSMLFMPVASVIRERFYDVIPRRWQACPALSGVLA